MPDTAKLTRERPGVYHGHGYVVHRHQKGYWQIEREDGLEILELTATLHMAKRWIAKQLAGGQS